MKHAEKLIGRILFLEGRPIVSKLNEIHIGAEVHPQFESDLRTEQDAVRAYNKAIRQCTEMGDGGTRELLEHILKDEEDHIDWIEAQLDEIKQMTIQHYLSMQIREED